MGELALLVFLERMKQGLSFERRLLRPAGAEVFIFFNLGRLRGARQMGELALLVFLERMKQGLSFERRLLRPAGAEVFIFFNLGRLCGGRSKGIKTEPVL